MPIVPSDSGRRICPQKHHANDSTITVASVEIIDLDDPVIVYDIQVHIDASFIVAGVVLHNSLICMSRDSLMWDKATKAPIGGHNKQFMNPPLHWQCRSTILGVPRSAAELERNGFDVPAGTRASMDGQVANSLNYEEWLKTKPESFQREVLGPRRHALWQAGKLPFSRLIDQSARPLTLDELV